MKKLYKLILRSFFGPFFLIFFIVLFVLLIQFLWRYIDELVGKGLDTKTIGELLLYTSASLVPMALPLSILMSSLMTFGNLGERYELTAIKASGISLQRVLRPLVVVVFFFSIGAFFFANNVLPYSNLQMRSLLYDIRQQRPELQIKPGEFNNLIDGYTIRIGDKDAKTNSLYEVTVYDHTQGKGNTSVTIADSGKMVVTANDQYLIITLYNGHSYNELFDPKKPRKKRSHPHRYDMFDEQQILIELTGFGLQRTDQNLFKSHYQMLNLSQLGQMKDSLHKEVDGKYDQINRSLLAANYFRKNKRKHGNTTTSKINDASSFQRKVSANKRPPQSIKNNEVYGELKNDSSNSDTAKASETADYTNVPLVDIDSLINSYTLAERNRITNAALSYARTAKNLVANSQQSLDYKIEQLRKYEIEQHRKFTISIACLLFLFIGAPLGAIIRKGGLGLPLIISVFFFILYYVLSLIGEKLVRESIMLDYQGMWMTSAIFAIIGVFITYKATTDSSIFNMDTYSNFIKKVFGQRYNVVDKINIDKEDLSKIQPKAKSDKLYSSLIDLNDSTENMLEGTKDSLRPTDFLAELFTPQNESNLVLYERFYYNTFKAIINNPLFHNKNVRAKTYEFPALNIKEFQESKTVKYILVVLACIPPFTIILAIRKLIKITVFRAKLKQIKRLIPEIGTLLKVAEEAQ